MLKIQPAEIQLRLADVKAEIFLYPGRLALVRRMRTVPGSMEVVVMDPGLRRDDDIQRTR
jgi:hypothetical protein